MIITKKPEFAVYVKALGFCLMSSGIAQADSLIDIYQLALKNDPAYLAGVHKYGADQEGYIQARANLLPTISFDASRTENQQEIKSSDNQVFGSGSTKYPTTEYTLSIDQSVYSYANWARLRQAESRNESYKAELNVVEQGLLLRTAEAYFAALAVYEEHSYIQAEEKSVQQHFELIEAKRKDGLARQTDFLDAQARYLQTKARGLEIRSRLKDSLEMIGEMTGETPASLALLKKDMAMPGPQPAQSSEWIATALEYNPEIKIRISNVDAAREEVKSLKGGHYPTLDLNLSYNNNATEGSLYGGGSEVSSTTATLSLNVPIYSGGLVSSRVRAATDLLSRTMQELSLEQRAVKRRTLSAFDGVNTDIAKVNSLAKSVESYELAVQAKRIGFESGITTSLAVLDAERDLFLARSEYSRARYGYILNTLRLKRAVGVLSAADLEQVNGFLGKISGGVTLLSDFQDAELLAVE
ncbi:TolC family outer membrane protein [Sansalvadorimonas verongulae]|uniref:TolC family outer membrane protein n=1 Tax=Sansalvadorimonas verongulae TaxID=2172824 RepID=UPI0012BBBC65|nr:TolC family outer membrane protein [Sansalvadorimonas verongulae]MTI14997.1 hypothetical protein [Sansalvadorimonas verongulae]